MDKTTWNAATFAFLLKLSRLIRDTTYIVKYNGELVIHVNLLARYILTKVSKTDVPAEYSLGYDDYVDSGTAPHVLTAITVGKLGVQKRLSPEEIETLFAPDHAA